MRWDRDILELARLSFPATDLPFEESRAYRKVIVCHMNVIRYFVCRALQLPPEAWLRMGGYNCAISHLQIRGGSGIVSLVSFGDHGHLSLEETTFGMRQGMEE